MNKHISNAISLMVEHCVRERYKPDLHISYQLRVTDLDDESVFVELYIPNSERFSSSKIVFDVTSNMKNTRKFEEIIKEFVNVASDKYNAEEEQKIKKKLNIG